jgi:hypothetical protein
MDIPPPPPQLSKEINPIKKTFAKVDAPPPPKNVPTKSVNTNNTSESDSPPPPPPATATATKPSSKRWKIVESKDEEMVNQFFKFQNSEFP